MLLVLAGCLPGTIPKTTPDCLALYEAAGRALAAEDTRNREQYDRAHALFLKLESEYEDCEKKKRPADTNGGPLPSPLVVYP